MKTLNTQSGSRLKIFWRDRRKLQIATLCSAAVSLLIYSTACRTEPAVPPKTAVTPVAQDLENAVQQATQAYIEAKNGDASFAWSVQKALDAYGLIVKTKADVKEVVQQWADGTKAGKSFAQKLADLFANYKGAPEQKLAKMSRAVTKATRHYTVPKRGLRPQEKAEIFKEAHDSAIGCWTAHPGDCDEKAETRRIKDRMRYRLRVDWKDVSPIVDAGWAAGRGEVLAP